MSECNATIDLLILPGRRGLNTRCTATAVDLAELLEGVTSPPRVVLGLGALLVLRWSPLAGFLTKVQMGPGSDCTRPLGGVGPARSLEPFSRSLVLTVLTYAPAPPI